MSKHYNNVLKTEDIHHAASTKAIRTTNHYKDCAEETIIQKIEIEIQDEFNECNIINHIDEINIKNRKHVKLENEEVDSPIFCANDYAKIESGVRADEESAIMESSTFDNSVHTVYDQISFLDSEQPPFNCTYCSKTFAKSGHLMCHMRIHTRDRPHKCSQCEKTFCDASVLKRHIVTHTGARPCKCTQCVKSFADLGQLRRHIRTHTGDKPFKCTQCDKSFVQSGHLQAHMLAHTDERSFKCTQCDKTFKRPNSLRRHQQTHRVT